MLRDYIVLILLASLSMLPAGATANSLQKKPIPQKDPCSGQIKYQSDVDSAYKYLEDVQRQIYTENPDLTDPYSREELNSPRAVASFADLKKRALKACPDPSKRETCALDPIAVDALMSTLPCLTLPTRFESPLFFYGISIYMSELTKVRASRFPTSSAARFGSLPTGTINAQAILPRDSRDPLVILNRDIFFFTGALSKSISDAIPISKDEVVKLDHSEEGIRKRLHDNPYIVANFADAMSRIVVAGSSFGANEATLDEDHNHIHARLVSAMDMFIIAHEEAHVILGHVSDKSAAFHLAGNAQNKRALPRMPAPQRSNSKENLQQSRKQVNDTATTLKTQLRTQKQELEADALGFKLLMWSERNGDDPVGEMMAAAAPHLVFRILDAVDTYGREVGGWGFSDANHPPAADRVNALSPVFDEIAKENELLRQVDFRTPFGVALKVLLTEADTQIRQNLGLPPKSRPN